MKIHLFGAVVFLIACLFLCQTSRIFGDGELDKFSKPYKKEGKSDNDKKDTQDTDDYKNCDNHDNHDYTGDSVIGAGLAALFTAPFRDLGYSYYPNPYGYSDGIYVVHNEDKSFSNSFAFQGRTVYQKVSQKTTALGIEGKVLFPSGCDIDLFNKYYVERQTGANDHMDYFTAHLNFAGFMPDRNEIFEAGAGWATLTDTSGFAHTGFSLFGGAELFIQKPWGIHLSGNIAWPSDRRITNYNMALSYHIDAFELYLGYNTLINSAGDALNGPMFGCGLWF